MMPFSESMFFFINQSLYAISENCIKIDPKKCKWSFFFFLFPRQSQDMTSFGLVTPTDCIYT